MRKRVFFTTIVLLSLMSYRTKAVDLPLSMSNNELQLVLERLTYGTSHKFINKAYSLGGFSGVELSFAMSVIPAREISSYGAGAPASDGINVAQLTVGKGITEDIDLFFSFFPYTESLEVGIYSAGLRWFFYEATFFPAVIGLQFHGTNSNIDNLLFSSAAGAEAIASMTAEPFSFYIGAGAVYGSARFDATLTSTGQDTTLMGTTFHSLLGLSLEVSNVFVAAQMDTYETTTFSGRVGIRF